MADLCIFSHDRNFLSVLLPFLAQGWGRSPWKARDSRAVFRGRDSNAVRVKLAQLSARHPELLDVAITSWENDDYIEAEEQLGGGRKTYLKLNEFSKYKYILALDGTVAAYRNPYLLSSTFTAVACSGHLMAEHETVFGNQGDCGNCACFIGN